MSPESTSSSYSSEESDDDERMKSSVPKEGVNEIRRKFLMRVSSEGIYRLYDEITELKQSMKEIRMSYVMDT